MKYAVILCAFAASLASAVAPPPEKNPAEQKILIDTFIVPEKAKAEFLARTHKVQAILKGLPGFVEGFLYEKKSGEGRTNFVTTAVWESEAAFEDAKKFVADALKKEGFDAQAFRKKWHIESHRAVYERSPY